MKLHQLGLLIFLLFFAENSLAQEVELKGRISSEMEETAFVNIINLTQKTGSISNQNGFFNIVVKPLDTLIFSAVQFERKEVIVTPEILKEDLLDVFLEEKNTFLQEVVINPYGLSGDLIKDAQNMPSYTFDYKAAGLSPPKKPRSQSERRLYTASSTSVDYIINSINGRIKQLRLLDDWSKLDDLKEDIQQRLPRDFFETELSIEDKYIEDFIYFCIEDNALKSYVQNNEDLEIINYLSLKADAYKVLKDNENTAD